MWHTEKLSKLLLEPADRRYLFKHDLLLSCRRLAIAVDCTIMLAAAQHAQQQEGRCMRHDKKQLLAVQLTRGGIYMIIAMLATWFAQYTCSESIQDSQDRYS